MLISVNCRVSSFSCNVYVVYLQKPLRVFVYFKKSCIFVYNRVYSCICSEKSKKNRKFEFQFTHYKPKFPCFLATYGFFYLRIVCYIEKIAFRLLLSLLEWLKFQGLIATFMRSIQILCNFVYFMYFVYISKSCIV